MGFLPTLRFPFLFLSLVAPLSNLTPSTASKKPSYFFSQIALSPSPASSSSSPSPPPSPPSKSIAIIEDLGSDEEEEGKKEKEEGEGEEGVEEEEEGEEGEGEGEEEEEEGGRLSWSSMCGLTDFQSLRKLLVSRLSTFLYFGYYFYLFIYLFVFKFYLFVCYVTKCLIGIFKFLFCSLFLTPPFFLSKKASLPTPKLREMMSKNHLLSGKREKDPFWILSWIVLSEIVVLMLEGFSFSFFSSSLFSLSLF